MRLLPPDVPVTAPLFAEVRRRQPDVDLVLLPPLERDPGPPPRELTDEDAVALRARLADEAVRLWPTAGAAPTTRLRYGSVEAAVRAEARLAGRPDDTESVVASLRARLADSAPDPAPDPAPDAGGADRVTGRVTCARTSGLVVLTLTSPEVVVGRPRARAVVRAGDR